MRRMIKVIQSFDEFTQDSYSTQSQSYSVLTQHHGQSGRFFSHLLKTSLYYEYCNPLSKKICSCHIYWELLPHSCLLKCVMPSAMSFSLIRCQSRWRSHEHQHTSGCLGFTVLHQISLHKQAQGLVLNKVSVVVPTVQFRVTDLAFCSGNFIQTSRHHQRFIYVKKST